MSNENQDQGAGEVREFRDPTGPLMDKLAQVTEANRLAGHAPATGPRSMVLPPKRSGAGVSPPPSQPPVVNTTPTVAAPAPPIASGVTGFSGIDLRDGVVVADNGDLFPINKQGIQDLTVFCFNVMILAQTESNKALVKALKLPMKKKESSDAGDEGMSELSDDENPPTVSEGPPVSEGP